MSRKRLLYVVAALVVLSLAAFLATRWKDAPRSAQSIEFLLDWKMGAFFSPYLLADADGYYAAEGLSVTFTEGQGAETSAKLIGQAKYKVGTSNAAATAIAIDHGIPVLSVAMIEQSAVTAIFSLKKTGIQVPADLIGKKLGVRYFDISHQEYLAMMKAQKLDPGKVKEVSVGFDLQPLLTGQVDALYNYAYAMPVVLREQGQEINIILVKDYGVNGYGSNIIANRSFAKNSSDALTRFLRASRKGWVAARATPEKAIDVLKSRYPETDAKLALANLKEQLKWLESSGDASLFSQTAERWNAVLDAYIALGLIKKRPQLSDVFSTAY